MYKIAIVEDEIVIGEALYKTLQKCGYRPLRPVTSYDEGVAILANNSPDVYLIDINLGRSRTGIELATKVRQVSNASIIFLTAYADEYNINQISEINAEGFLVKPVSQVQLNATITLALKKKSKDTNPPSLQDQIITIKDGYKYVPITVSNILYVESDRNYVIYHLSDGKKYMERTTLTEIDKILQNMVFLKINRSHILNVAKITKLTTQEAFLSDLSFKITRQIREDLVNMIRRLK
jgi:DNA-binding LytR/AlgR family response regulator